MREADDSSPPPVVVVEPSLIALISFLNSLTHRDRFLSDGGKDLGEVLRRWKPWLPPKQSQAVLQGGAVCFDGRETVFLHRDPATGAHADFEAALEALGA